jgi:hypothetical protein
MILRVSGILEQGGVRMKKYLIVVEESKTRYPADSPDLPDCA